MSRVESHNPGASCSVMIVSERDAFTQCMSEILLPDDDRILTNQTETFKAMNGHAADLAFKHDVVIIDADPDDEGELKAIRELLAERKGNTVFLALTDAEMSIAKARQLREIGVDEVLPVSITGDGLRAVINEKMMRRQAPQQDTADGHVPLGQVLAVSQARGGIGATTVAVNLACSLVGRSGLFGKTRKARVALLDFDLQFGNLNVFLDLEDNGGFLQTVEALEAPDERFVNAVMQRHDLGVDVLCAPLPIAPLQTVRPDTVAEFLDILQRKYDYIVVDFPRALVDWVEPVLRRATKLIMVTDTTVPCIRQARRLIDFYSEDNIGLGVELVVNREKRPLLKSEHLREAEKVLKTKLTHWLPDNPKVARMAADLGKPIVDIKPRSDLGKALSKTAQSLTADTRSARTKRV